jgi:hypothetical protein
MPSARVRFAIEAAFLLIVAGGAALAKLSPAQIILLMFVAWVLVALIERASSRAQSRPAPVGEADPARRRWSWRRTREAPALVDPTAVLEEHPAPTHVTKLEPEREPQPAVQADVAEVVAEERAPVVTKRALDLRGLEQAEVAPPPPPEPEPEREPEPVVVAQQAPPPQPPPAPPTVPQASTPAPPAAPPAPREWNLWELERQARNHAGEAARDEEWTALFVHLRQFANTEGLLPKEFDGLVRESFAELIPAA